jgi:hypothetical protein
MDASHGSSGALDLNDPGAAAELMATDIDALVQALAAPGRREMLLRAVDRIAAERVGVVVFSASTCPAESLMVERVYSSCPETYPVGAKTNKRETSWGRQVLQQHRVFVGEGALEMAAAFDDQASMERAGVRSIINVPIIVSDKCVAVLNFGFGTERLAARQLAVTKLLGLAASAAFLA